MAGTLSINHGIAAETGKQLLLEQESIRESFELLSSANQALSTAWQGSASSAFVESIDLLTLDGKTLAASLLIFGGDITEANLTLEETDMLIASRFNGLGH